MTVRNGAPFVEEAIQSLLGQTDPHFEVVVVDDGSTDGTLDILRRFSDPRLLVVDRPPIGRAEALIEAIARARGALIAVLDADDVALPDRFARQRAYLNAHPDIALVGSTAIDFDERHEWRRPTVTGPRSVRRALAMYNPFYHSSVMFRREAYEAVGGYQPDGGWGHDNDLLIRVASRYSVDIIPEPLIRYRHHPGQLTASPGEGFRRRKAARLQLVAARRLRLPALLWVAPLLSLVYAHLPPIMRPARLKEPTKRLLLSMAGVLRGERSIKGS